MPAFDQGVSEPTVDSIIRLRDSAYATDMFVAAVSGLDFFTWLSNNPANVGEICSGLGLARRPADVMINLFKAWGLVRIVDGRVEATRVSKSYLNAASSQHILPYITSLSGRNSVKEMEALLRDDISADWHPTDGSAVQDWQNLMRDEDFAEDYIDAMDRRGAVFAPRLCKVFCGAETLRLLDVAGGSGIYTVHILNSFPMMTATLLDRAPVDRFAARAFERAGLTERTDVVTRDMFADPLPTGHDHHLYSHVMHNWPPEKVRLLIEKSFSALDPGGRISIFGSHLNDTDSGPSGVPMAEYSVLLAFLYPGRCYGLKETADMLADAGFLDPEWTMTGADRSVVTAKKP